MEQVENDANPSCHNDLYDTEYVKSRQIVVECKKCSISTALR